LSFVAPIIVARCAPFGAYIFFFPKILKSSTETIVIMVVNCEVCSKSVYPLEAIVVQDKSYHKMCFKCQDGECGLQLTIKTAQSHASTGKVYCAKHYPKEKATVVTTSVELDRAKNAPKLATVNQQKRGDGMENPTVTPDSLHISNAVNAPKLATVNQQKRGDSMENPTVTSDSLHISNAANAPKLATVNQQVRGDEMEHPTVTQDSLQIQNAKTAHLNAQKLHNDNVRGTGDVPESVIDRQMESAINAPKLATVNEQKRGDNVESPNFSSDALHFQNAKSAHVNAQKLHNDNVRGTGEAPHTSIHDIAIDNAINAPKVDVQSNEIRGTGEKANFNVIV